MKRNHGKVQHHINYSNKLLKERLKEEKKEVTPATEVPVRNSQKEEMASTNIKTLSNRDYKLHKKAKEIFADTIGNTSKELFENKITKEQFEKLQIEGAKLAIRTVGLVAAIRAWGEVFYFILRLPDQKSKGIPIIFNPTLHYMRKYGMPSNLVINTERLEELEKAVAEKEAVEETEKVTDINKEIINE